MDKKNLTEKVKKPVKKIDKNTLLFEEITSCLSQGIFEIALDKIRNLGFDISSGSIELANLKLEKKLFSNFFKIESIDASKDKFKIIILKNYIVEMCHLPRYFKSSHPINNATLDTVLCVSIK